MSKSNSTQTRAKHNSGSVYYMKSRDRWVCAITVDGKQKVSYHKTSKEAVAHKRKALYELHEQGIKPSDKRQTVHGYASHWLELKGGITSRVRETYKGHLSRHIEDNALGKMRLAEVRPDDIRTFIKGKQEDGLSNAYIQHILSPLNQAFEQAVDDDVIPRNPISKVTRPQPRKGTGRALSVAQVSRLLEAIRGDVYASRNYALYVLAFETGARIGELLALRWSRVNLEAGTVRIDASLRREKGQGLVIGPPKTESGNRTIPLQPEHTELLRKHRARQNELRLKGNWEDNDLVFCTNPDKNGTALGGRPLEHTNIRRTWNRVLKLAGLEGYRVYDTRHTLLTRLAEIGVNPDTTRMIAGHKDVRTSLTYYTHTTANMMRDAMERFGNVYTSDSDEAESA